MLSTGLRITEHDDWMRKEKDCVVLTNNLPPPVKPKVGKIVANEDGSYTEIHKDGQQQTLQETKISLADCLACSGCITTAETVLIEAQGVKEFVKHLNGEKVVVISVSPQSRASLAAHYGLTNEETLAKLCTMFKSLGVQYIFDTGYGDEISLLEAATEFVDRKRSGAEGSLPMICSSCPGWICYAEKTHPELLPLVSTTKSPQQVMGSLVKGYFASQQNIPSKQIYHVAIMPCYDRKLEASRQDFYFPETDLPEVDMVLATSEILQLIQDRKVDFPSLPSVPLGSLPMVQLSPAGQLTGVRGGTSGGFLEYIYKYAAKELFNKDVVSIQYQKGRNADFVEVSLIGDDGQPLLRFARANGFRNIQNIVRRLKQKRTSSQVVYDFIEIMACPGGCTNGGGQIGSSATKSDMKKNIHEVNQIYDSTYAVQPGWHPTVDALYKQICNNSSERKQILHTQYHPVAKLDTNPLAIKW